jgi:hypothetical protein
MTSTKVAFVDRKTPVVGAARRECSNIIAAPVAFGKASTSTPGRSRFRGRERTATSR